MDANDGNLMMMCRFAEEIQARTSVEKVTVALNPISGSFHHVVDGKMDKIPKGLWTKLLKEEEKFVNGKESPSSTHRDQFRRNIFQSPKAKNMEQLVGEDAKDMESLNSEEFEKPNGKGVTLADPFETEEGKNNLSQTPTLLGKAPLDLDVISEPLDKRMDTNEPLRSNEESDGSDTRADNLVSSNDKLKTCSNSDASEKLLKIIADQAKAMQGGPQFFPLTEDQCLSNVQNEGSSGNDSSAPRSSPAPSDSIKKVEDCSASPLEEVLAEMDDVSDDDTPEQTDAKEVNFMPDGTKAKAEEQKPGGRKRKHQAAKDQWDQILGRKKPSVRYSDLKGGLQELLDSAGIYQNEKQHSGSGILAHKPGEVHLPCLIDKRDPYGIIKDSFGVWKFFNSGKNKKGSFLKSRCRFINIPSPKDTVQGFRVVYWVSSTPRIYHNFALQLAILLSLKLQMPLQVVAFVHPGLQGYSGVTSRHHAGPSRASAFHASAILEFKAALEEKGIPLYGLLGDVSEPDMTDKALEQAAQCLYSFCSGSTSRMDSNWGPAHVLITDEGGYHPRFERFIQLLKPRLPQLGIFGVDSNFMWPITPLREEMSGQHKNASFPSYKDFKRILLSKFWKEKPHIAWGEYDDQFQDHLSRNNEKISKIQSPLFVLGSGRHIYIDPAICSAANMVINWKEIKSKIRSDFFFFNG